MKKAAIICLLSLTLCLSQAASPPDLHKAATQDPATSTVDPKLQKPAEIHIETPSVSPAKQNASKPAETATKPANKTEAATPAKTEPSTSDNKTEQKNKTEPTVKPTEHETAAKVTEPTTEAKAKESTTVAPSAKPSETPKDVTEKPALIKARGFDGPSFIGGIILTLGLLAIGFMGFKYYKNQTERNYHTL